MPAERSSTRPKRSPERAAEEYQRGEGEQVAVEDPLQFAHPRAEIAADVGRATLTTVPSRNTIEDPATATAS